MHSRSTLLICFVFNTVYFTCTKLKIKLRTVNGVIEIGTPLWKCYSTPIPVTLIFILIPFPFCAIFTIPMGTPSEPTDSHSHAHLYNRDNCGVFNRRFNIIYGFDDLRFQNVFQYGHSGRGHWVPRRPERRFELLQPSHATEFLSVCDDLKLQRVKHFTLLTDNRGFATLYLYNIKLISALVRLRGAPTAR